MSHTTTLTIDGSPVAIAAQTPWPTRLSMRLRGYSTLSLMRRTGARDVADPYLGKTVELSIDGDVVFSGDIVDADPQFTEAGWSTLYQCHDLRARGDRVPFTDSNTLGAYATYNYDAEDPDKIDARLGRTTGQIIADVLTMQANADALDALGIGGYTSLSPPTLPADTVADLAAMDVIMPYPVRVGGEHMLGSIESMIQDAAPNFAMWVRPDGIIRFIDQRTPTEHVLTWGDCDQRVEVTGLSRSVSECYQRVVVRGSAIALPKLLSLSNGGLLEDFAWGALSSAAAKAAYTPNDYLRDQDARSVGTCSCTDLTHVVVTSAPGTQTWGSNEWDQSHRRGTLYVSHTAGSGFDQFFTSRIVANTSKSSGGTSTLTLETPLPSTSFDKFAIYGLSSGASLVYRKYKVADATIAAALANRMTYPVPYVNSTGSAASLTSYPQASVVWTLPGSTVPLEFFDPIVSIDRSAGTFLLGAPTYSYNNAPPADVRILAAVNTGVLSAVKPASGYEGTSHTVEGLERTLTITVDSWRDPANLVNIQAYAQDQLDAVKDSMVEGAVTIHDMFIPGLTFGLGISIDAIGYDTGWEDLNAPVVAVDLVWNSRAASHYKTVLQVSTRRACYGAQRYLQPERRMSDGTMGFGGGWSATSYAWDGGDGGVIVGTGQTSGLPSGGWVDPSTGMMDPSTGLLDPSQGWSDPSAGWVSPSTGSMMGGDDGTSGMEAAGGLDADWSAPGGNVSGKYGGPKKYSTAGKYSTAKPYSTTKTPYSTARKFSSTTTAELAADRARSKESRQAKAAAKEDRRRERDADRMLRGSVIDTSSMGSQDWTA